MNNHTPGPWGIDENLEFAVIDNSDTIICQMPYAMTAMQHYANARLIAAAPEMYELLANLAAVCDSWDEDYENDEQRADAFWHMARIAKVLLLTKIEGGGE